MNIKGRRKYSNHLKIRITKKRGKNNFYRRSPHRGDLFSCKKCRMSADRICRVKVLRPWLFHVIVNWYQPNLYHRDSTVLPCDTLAVHQGNIYYVVVEKNLKIGFLNLGVHLLWRRRRKKTLLQRNIKRRGCPGPGSPKPTGPSAGPRLAKPATQEEEGVENVWTELQWGRRKYNVLNQRMVRDNWGMRGSLGCGREKNEQE